MGKETVFEVVENDGKFIIHHKIKKFIKFISNLQNI